MWGKNGKISKEFWKKVEFNFKERTPNLKFNHKYTGIVPGLNPFVINNTSARNIMLYGQTSSSLELNEVDEPIILTGIESDLLNHIEGVKITDEPVEILGWVDRYVGDENELVERVVAVLGLKTSTIDILRLKKYDKKHPYFGFELTFEDAVKNMRVGQILNEGDFVTEVKNHKDKEFYTLGRNINVAFMSLPDVDEDGFIVSESFLDKFKFTTFVDKVIEVGEDKFLLNVHGDDDNYKPFLRIGEKLEDSVVFAARSYGNEEDIYYYPSLFSKKAVRKYNPYLDEVIYAEPGGEIVDLKVYYNNKRKKELPTGTDELFKEYSRKLVNFHESIIKLYRNIVARYPGYRIGNTFKTLVKESLGIVDAYKNYKINLMIKKRKLDLYRIETTIKYVIRPTKGFKPTDMSGAKGTIVRVWPDEWMPVDEYGNRAEMIADPRSTIARNNTGRLMEKFINGASREVKRRVVELMNRFNCSNVDECNNEQIRELFSLINNFIKHFETEQSILYQEVLDKNDFLTMKEIVREAVEKEVRVFYNIEQDKKAFEIITDIIEAGYGPKYSRVKFTYNGREVVSKQPIMIAPLKIMLLNKIADDLISAATAPVNNFGIPTSVSKDYRDRLPYRNKPFRGSGETETRIFTGYCGREFMAILRHLNTNLDVHQQVIKNILHSNSPTAIDEIIDLNQYPLNGGRVMEILKTILNIGGIDIDYVEDLQRYHLCTKTSPFLEEESKEILDIETSKEVDNEDEE